MNRRCSVNTASLCERSYSQPPRALPLPVWDDASMQIIHVDEFMSTMSTRRPSPKIKWPIYDDVAARRSLRESQFFNHVDRLSKTGLMINNVRHAFLWTLPSCLLCVWCRKKQSKWASLTKVSTSRKCLRAKKMCYSLSYWWKKAPHQPTTKLYGKTCDLVAAEQGKLWEGQRRKSDSDSDGDTDSDRDLRVEKLVTFSVFEVCS